MSAAGKRAAGKNEGKERIVTFKSDKKTSRNKRKHILDGAIRKALDTLKRKVSELGTIELGCLERVLAMTVGDARRWSWNEIGGLFGIVKMIAHRVQSNNSSVIVSALEGAMARVMVIKTSKAKCYEHMDTNEVRPNAPFEALIANLGAEPPDITQEATVQKRTVRVQAGTLLSAENNNFPATPAIQIADPAPEDAVRVADPAPENTATPVPSEDVTRSSDDESDEDGTFPGDLKGVEGTLPGEFDTQEVAEILSELPSSQRSM